MPVPGQSPIQFVPPDGAVLYVDQITDPGGPPNNVIDVDKGFTVSGRVDLPNWLDGTGTVTIYADELGGTTDRALVPNAIIPLIPSPAEPSPKTYPWTIAFPGSPPVLPDPSPGSQIYHLAAKFMYEGQTTDIAGFVLMGYYLIN